MTVNQAISDLPTRQRWSLKVIAAVGIVALGISGAIAALLLAGGSSSGKSPSTVANGYIEAGVTAENHGQLTAAIADYEAAIRANPRSASAYYDLGVIYQSQKNNLAASVAYQNALLILPNYKSALFNLAILVTPTEPATAVALYNRLLSLNSNDANVLFNLGLLLRRLGNTTAGNADLAKAISLSPSLTSRLPVTTPSTTATTVKP